MVNCICQCAASCGTKTFSHIILGVSVKICVDKMTFESMDLAGQTDLPKVMGLFKSTEVVNKRKGLNQTTVWLLQVGY